MVPADPDNSIFTGFKAYVGCGKGHVPFLTDFMADMAIDQDIPPYQDRLLAAMENDIVFKEFSSSLQKARGKILKFPVN